MPRKKEDDAAKYAEASEHYDLNEGGGALRGVSQVDRVHTLLLHAIENQLPGFRIAEGAVIGVAHAAEGLKTSRTTINQAIDRLVARGYLAEARNAPYRIVSDQAQLPPPDQLILTEISLTQTLRKLGGSAAVERRLTRVPPDRKDPFRRILDDGLESTWDNAVRKEFDEGGERLKRWRDEDVYAFFRLRHLPRQLVDEPRGWLVEIGYLSVEPDAADAISEALSELPRPGSAHVNLRKYLERKGDVEGVTGGMSRLRVEPIPLEVIERVENLPGIGAVDPSPVVGRGKKGDPARERPCLLRWEYPFFAREPRPGMVAYFVCYLNPEIVQIYIREHGIVGEEPTEDTFRPEGRS